MRARCENTRSEGPAANDQVAQGHVRLGALRKELENLLLLFWPGREFRLATCVAVPQCSCRCTVLLHGLQLVVYILHVLDMAGDLSANPQPGTVKMSTRLYTRTCHELNNLKASTPSPAPTGSSSTYPATSLTIATVVEPVQNLSAVVHLSPAHLDEAG